MLYETGFCLQGAKMRRGQKHHKDTPACVDLPDIASRDCLSKMSSMPHRSITAWNLEPGVQVAKTGGEMGKGNNGNGCARAQRRQPELSFLDSHLIYSRYNDDTDACRDLLLRSGLALFIRDLCFLRFPFFLTPSTCFSTP